MAMPAMAAKPCAIHPLELTDSKASLGIYRVAIAEPNAAPATVWDGPIMVKSPHGTCKTSEDLSLIAAPLWADNQGHLWVQTYSGSNDTFNRISLDTCEVEWSESGLVQFTGKAFSFKPMLGDDGKISVKARTLALDASCNVVHAGKSY